MQTTWSRSGKRGENILKIFHGPGLESWIALCDYHQRIFFERHPEAVGNGQEMRFCRLCEKGEAGS